MKASRLLNAMILVIPLLAAAWVPAAGAPPAASSRAAALDKIESAVLQELAANGQAEFFVWMAAKADLRPAYQLHTKEEKGRFVYETLRETAERTQRGLRRYLDVWGVDYRPFYIANKILVRGGTPALVHGLSVRADVAHIAANHELQLDEPPLDPSLQEQTLGVESNISFVNADDAWALGVTGQGIVLANNDTGLDWDHPALMDHYRGWNGSTVDHNYNWWDATGTFSTAPGDDHGHGTHTTGTMVGSDGGSNQIGMAPGAKTIHCKNMTANGLGTDATFTECFEWNLAPWDLNGQNPNPNLAPDAINNSWGYTTATGQFKDEIAALHAAGILVEASAGNEGPFCSSLRSPGDYAEVLTTGSVNHSSAYPGTVALFSSRGPSDLDGGIFPDIMAPGENIRSSMPGGGYGYKSGTSMAGPHATGLVGLIWSACPNLRGQVAQTIQVIHETAVPLAGYTLWQCGGDYTTGPNNEWGYGTIDALAAVQACGDLPPSVGIVSPAADSTVAGPITVQLDATDAEDARGTLTVEWNVDGGAWQPTIYNYVSGYYEADWNSTLVDDGPHTINARAIDSASNVGADSNGVTVDNVNELPVATFTYECSGLACDFDAAGSHDPDGTIVSHAWDFGDGNSGSGVTASHTYAMAGSYTVVLTVTDDDGAPDTDLQDVTVENINELPVATFTYECSDLACDFDAAGSHDPDGSIVTYAWDFADGNSGSGVMASHTYAKAGSYSVVLTVTDNDGATDTDGQTVTVSDIAPVTFHVADLDGSSVDAPRGRWDATVTVTVHDSNERTISGALVEGTWSGGTSGGGSCTTIAGQCNITKGNLKGNVDSVTFSVTNVTSSAGTYTVASNHDPDGDSDGTTITVTRPGSNTSPTITITAPTEGANFISGASIDFVGTASDAEDGDITADLVWSSDIDGQVGTGGGFSAVLSDGVHTITAAATDSAGASGRDAVSITVGNPPPPTSMHVGDLDGTSELVRNKWTATITITVHSETHDPVIGAVVDAAWSDGTTGTGSCTTGATGSCEIIREGISTKSASVALTIDNVTRAGYTYAPGANHDLEGDSDSDGTSITVTKP